MEHKKYKIEYTMDFTSQEDWDIIAEQAMEAGQEWKDLADKMHTQRKAKESKLAFRLAMRWLDIASAIRDIERFISEWNRGE